jgi:ABC-2 type transport system ATP-binding protein
MEVIFTQDLIRIYKTNTGIINRKNKLISALDGINLSVNRGELFGLLGPNGAGKTTLTRILSTVLLPTSGVAQVFGMDVVKEAKEIRPRIGIVFGGDRGLYWRLSGRDNLEYFATLYGIPKEKAGKRIQELLEQVGLADRANEATSAHCPWIDP